VADIKALEGRFIKALLTKDVNAIMAFYVPDASLFVFDVTRLGSTSARPPIVRTGMTC
jgi:ketosteroid isomerase-like protein